MDCSLLVVLCPIHRPLVAQTLFWYCQRSVLPFSSHRQFRFAFAASASATPTTLAPFHLYPTTTLRAVPLRSCFMAGWTNAGVPPRVCVVHIPQRAHTPIADTLPFTHTPFRVAPYPHLTFPYRCSIARFRGVFTIPFSCRTFSILTHPHGFAVPGLFCLPL